MKDKNYRALLITNSTFPQDPNLADLEGPRNDAAVLRAALVDPAVGMFSPDRVRLVTERTEFNVRREIEKFFATANKHETLFLYYSGHGILTPSSQLYLCSHDTRKDELATTAVPSTWISSVIEESAAQVTVIILDCCHAGAFKSGDDDLTPSLAGQGRFLLASCRPNQLAGDADTDNHASIFTAVLAEGLIEGAPDLDNDGVIRLQDLHLYADARLRDAGKPRPHANFVGIGNVPMAFRPHGYPPELSPRRIDVGVIRLRKRVSGKRFDVISHDGAAGWWTPESVESWVSIEKDDHGFGLVLTPPKGKQYATVIVRDHDSGLSTSGVITVDRRPIPAWLSAALICTFAIIALVEIIWTPVRNSSPNSTETTLTSADSIPNVATSAIPTSPIAFNQQLLEALPRAPNPIPDDDLVVSRQVNGAAALYKVNSTTMEIGSPLTPVGAERPVISPDRRSIVYVILSADGASSSIRVVAADGTGDRELFPRIPQCQRYLTPAWNPVNPDQLAIACLQAGVWFSMMIVGLDGTIVQDFKIANHWVDDLSFSPDGQTLAYMSGMSADYSGNSGVGRIFTVPADGSAQPIPLTDEFTDRGPVWSPNGRQIVFSREVRSDSTHHEIFVMSSDGSGQKAIGESTSDDQSPVWSVDGTQIAFSSNRDVNGLRQNRWWLMDSNGANVHPLNPDDGAVAFSTPAWGPR